MSMKRTVFKILARINKVFLPTYSFKGIDLYRAPKLQLIILEWRCFVTKHSL